MTTNKELQQASLRRATTSLSEANYDAIIEGFVELGIDEEEILPRENIFTYNAWLALGRQVKRGEHGVRITTFIPVKNSVFKSLTGEDGIGALRPKITTVFHISQTDKMEKGNE